MIKKLEAVTNLEAINKCMLYKLICKQWKIESSTNYK